MDARTGRRRAAGRGAWLAVLLALLVAAPEARPQEPTAEDWSLASTVVEALRHGDTRTLAQLVDFPLRSAEGLARGRDRVGWDDLDDLGRLLETKEVTEAWLDAQPRFFESATLYNIRLLEDPDAGWGPVPRRRVVQAVAKASRTGELADLVLVATPDGRLLDLRVGEPYVDGLNPLGPDGLQPEPRPELDGLRVTWPGSVDEYDREAVEELVDDLLAADRLRDRRAITEMLHRSPRAAAAALLERVLALDESSAPDAVAQGALMEALETITGRGTAFAAVPSFGQDEGAWRAANRSELASWVRWHRRHGATFQPAPVENPVLPTHGERPVARSGGSDEEKEEAADDAAEAPSLPGRRGPRVASAPRPAAAPRPAPRPAPEPEPEEEDDDDAARPGVTFRRPESPAAGTATLTEAAAALEILWGERRVTAGEVADELPTPVRKLLDGWAEDIADLGLSVCSSGNPDHLVVGRVDDELLVAAAKRMDAAWDVLQPVTPALVRRTPRPVLAVLFGPRDPRDEEYWPALLAALQRRRALLPDEVPRLLRDPSGVMARNAPMFLQPIFDLAGNAAAGDDEFRLANEVVHKFGQCYLTQRAGQLPATVRWGIGHVLENRLVGSVYQFDTTGFVASGDHFDWPRRAHRLLEKEARKRSWSAARLLLGHDEPRSEMDNTVMVWGLLEGLLGTDPAAFTALLEALGEVHAETDPYGLASDYQGAEAPSVQAAELRLRAVEFDAILDHLDALR